VAIGGWFNQRRSIRQQPTQLEDVPVVEMSPCPGTWHPTLRIGQRVQVTISSSAACPEQPPREPVAKLAQQLRGAGR